MFSSFLSKLSCIDCMLHKPLHVVFQQANNSLKCRLKSISYDNIGDRVSGYHDVVL